MRKILILAVEQVNNKLEEKLRHKFDIEVGIVPHNSVCEIKANIKSGMLQSSDLHLMKV